MLNRINRFVRNIESKYDCDKDNLIIETAVYVPERIASRTNIPWKTIFGHISGFIAEDQVGIREITQFSVANNSNGTQTVTLGFRDAENISQVSSVQLSVPDAISLAFGDNDSLTSNSSASALISAGLSYKYGGEDKSVSAERYITNLVRSVSISGISFGGDKSNISASIALSVNGLSMVPVSSNSHQMAGIGIKSIDGLSVSEETNGIQNIKLGYYTTDSNKISSVSANLSVMKITGFALSGPDSNMSNSSISAQISANIDYVYGGQTSGFASNTIINNLIRSIAISSIDLNYSESSNTLSTSLNYAVNGSLETPVSSNSINLSSYHDTFAITGLTMALPPADISSDILSTIISYNTNNSASNTISTTVNLSAYKSVTEEDPIFWQSEHSIPVAISANELTGVINEISTAQYHEQSYVRGSAISGTYNLMMPAAQSDKVGAFTLYMEENPTENPTASFVYNLSSANIRNLPTRRSWLSAGGAGIWKFEFVSIPGSDKWQYVQSTKFKTT